MNNSNNNEEKKLAEDLKKVIDELNSLSKLRESIRKDRDMNNKLIQENEPKEEMKLTFDDVLLIPNYSEINSRKDVSLEQTLSGEKYYTPIISAPMDTISGSAMANWLEEKEATACMHRNWDDKNVPDFIKNVKNPHYHFWAIGLKEDHKLDYLFNELGVNLFCLDVAHGDQKQVYNKIEQFAKKSSDIKIMGGNVVTKDATERMRDAGAKFVRVGVGSGAACSTRLMTGFGYPQLSAIEECSKVEGINIVADGGIKHPGDIVKALAFGADLVMVGRMLAGTQHTPGIVEFDHQVKTYRGMASKEVNEDMFGGLGKHRAAEGESYSVPYKNEEQTEALWQNIIGGIRSGLAYAGAKNIYDLRLNAEYVTVSRASQIESTVHGKT